MSLSNDLIPLIDGVMVEESNNLAKLEALITYLRNLKHAPGDWAYVEEYFWEKKWQAIAIVSQRITQLYESMGDEDYDKEQ